MKIVLTGIQGAGKSTQGNLLSQQLNIPYLSTGHIFREIAKEKTTLGRNVKELISAGLLIPDELTITIVNSYISRPEYRNGYILDGFPRTIEQAEKFRNNVDRVIYVQIPDKEALWRLAYRDDSKRDDNTIQALRNRIEIFHRDTEPILRYYEEKGKLSVVDGTKTIEEVNDEILKMIGKHVVHNTVTNWKHDHKTIVALVGMPGAGKSEAAEFFTLKGLPIISFGKVINDYIDKKKLEHTEEVHKKVREELRETHGKEALAVLNKKKIITLFKKHTLLVIDGMRSWEEYEYITKEFPDVRIYVVAIYADKNIRYERVHQRQYRKGLTGAERDMNELIGTNMGPTIAFADYLVKNNYSKEDFYDKLEEVYRAIYFRG